MKKDSHLFKGESFHHIASDCRFHQADSRCRYRKSGQVESEWRWEYHLLRFRTWNIRFATYRAFWQSVLAHIKVPSYRGRTARCYSEGRIALVPRRHSVRVGSDCHRQSFTPDPFDSLHRLTKTKSTARGAFHNAGFTYRKSKGSTSNCVRTPFHTSCSARYSVLHLLGILPGGNIAFLREEGGTRSVTEGARVTVK